VVLFNDAKKLVEAGDYAAACPKFVEVRRALPTAGLFLNLGDCYEHLGKLASAWGAFKDAERIARDKRDDDRQGEGAKRALAIEGKLSRLTITVGPAERLPGLKIKRDGAEIGEGQWGSALPVDAGEHEIEVSAPGFRPWSTRAMVPLTGEAPVVAVPRLVPDAEATPSAAARWWNGQRIGGVVLVGLGVVGLSVGAGTGARAMGVNADSKRACTATDPDVCSSAGVDLRREAFTLAHVSTAGFIVGAAALVGGVVVMATASANKPAAAVARFEAAPWVGAGLGGIALRGAW
jgi:hypothetical protein